MRAVFASLLLCGALMSWVKAEGSSEGRVVFQSIEVSNDGRGAVSAVSILYGENELIRGPALQQYPAGNARFNTYAQGLDSVIPERTRVHWVTEDGVPHDATIPTRSLVRDRDAFYGFRFYIADDHVDVYLTEKIPNPRHYLNLKYTKVYSSH